MASNIRKFKSRLAYLTRREIMAQRLWARLKLERPFPKQQAVLDAWINGAQFILLRCGRRGAKTVTATLPLLAETAFGPPGNLPKRMLLHTGPDADVTDRVGGYLWRWLMVDKLYDFRPKIASERERYIELPWACRIEGKTTKATSGEPTHLLGEGIVGTIADEHARDRGNILGQYLLPPLADHDGWLIIPTTPKGRKNHLYETERDWKARMESGDPRYYVAHWTSWENPYINHQIFRDFKEFCQRTDQMELYYQEIEAEYVSITGSIYRRFSPTIGGQPWHVDRVNFIPYLPIYLGIDWGTDHPFVCLFGQVVDGDRLRIFDMISETGLDPEQMVDRVLDRLEWYGQNYRREMDEAGYPVNHNNPARYARMAYCDPSGLGNKKLFIKRGFKLFAASSKDRAQLNDVYGGIMEVSKLFARKSDPGLQIDNSCGSLISGIENYVWKEGGDREPEKIDDDEVDALRYMVMGLFGIKQKMPELLVI